jgi:hypothetical protein
MRTTVRLDPALLRAAKRHAAEAGTTFTALVEDALREILSRGKRGSRTAPVRLPTFRGTGLLPGVDLDDSAALESVMDA